MTRGKFELQDLGRCFHGSLPHRVRLRPGEGWLCGVGLTKREPRDEADACAGSCVLSYPAMCVNMLLTCLKMLSETRENVCLF
jgi:hypothetical protein